MPWCPICKNEYQEGITTCADCNSELVERLTEENTVFLIVGEEESMRKLLAFLEYNEVTSGTMSFKDEPDQYEIRVGKKDEERAKRIASIFLQELLEEQKNAIRVEKEEMTEEQEHAIASNEMEELRKPSKLYEKKTDRAEEHKSSAIALIGVGLVGIVFLILYWLGIIPLSLNLTTKYMMTGVMGGAFVLFFIMGIHSLSSFRVLKKEGEEENRLEQEVWNFCRETITQEKVFELLKGELSLEDGQESEEILYFKRAEKIKVCILEEFPQLDEGFLEQLTDDYYAELFG